MRNTVPSSWTFKSASSRRRKQANLIVLQGLDTSGKDGTVRHVMTAMNPQGVHVRPFKFSPSDTKERSHWDEYQEAFNMFLTRCSTLIAPWYIVPVDDKTFRDWAVSRLLLETLRAMNPRVPMPKLNVPGLVRQLPPVD